MTNEIEEQDRDAEIYACVQFLQALCYNDSASRGWHSNRDTGVPFTDKEQDEKFPTRIALIHSEVSEALEAHRSDKMDDKIHHRSGAEVELADALIRIFDLGGAMGYDLAGALTEKRRYNAIRKDHDPANRKKAGGKKY